MILTHKPAGAEPQEWTFRFDDLPYEEAELLEEHLGGSFEELKLAISKGSVRARRVLLWLFLRRSNGALKLKDVKPKSPGEIELAFESVELDTYEKELVKQEARKDLTPDERQELKTVRAALAAARGGDADDSSKPAEPEAPKDEAAAG